ncbi:MAG: VOC family protein [Pseudomonadota bacterium]
MVKLKTIYTIVSTAELEAVKAFYAKYFGFKAVFDTGWYVQLNAPRDGSDVPLELGFMLPGNEDLIEEFKPRFNGQGMFISLEVDDVDSVYAQVTADGFEPVQDLQEQPWGQRHFIIRDPGGTFLEVVTLVSPTDEFRQQFPDFYAGR